MLILQGTLCLLWAALLFQVQSNAEKEGVTEEPLEVKFDNTATRYLNVGDEVNFTCNVNRNIGFMMGDDVNVFLKQDWANKTYHLFEKMQYLEDANQTYYRPWNTELDESMDFHYTFKSIRQRDDGKLVCECNGVKSELEIVVQRPMALLSVQVDRLSPITQSVKEPLLVDSKNHTIVCKAMGSNPATTDVKIYLAGEEIKAKQPVIEQEGGELRNYTTTVTAIVDLRYKDHHEQDIKCVATDTQDKRLSVVIPVKINTPEPIITCETIQAYAGKQMVSLKCTVKHRKIRIDGFSFKIVLGKKEFIVTKDEPQTIYDSIVQVEETKRGIKTIVALEFQEIKEEYFASSIHLIVESSGGHLTEQLVELKKLPGPHSGSPIMTFSFATVLLASFLPCLL